MSLTATAVIYACFAVLLAAHGEWLQSIAGPHAPLLARLVVPIRRAARDFALVAACAIAIHFVYAVLARRACASRRVAPRRPARAQVAREILLVANLYLAIGVQAALYIVLKEMGYTRVYTDIAQYGWGYAIASGVFFIVFADAWSYFSHLAFHRSRFLYRNAHYVHHLSVVTTPWSTSQGSPFELLPSTLFAALVLTTIPLCIPVFIVVTLAGMVHQMVVHGGVEVFPRGTATHPLGRWIVTPTYHQMHHEVVDGNMGFYFTWWDSLMGTRISEYPARFAKVTGESRASLPEGGALTT